MSGNSPGSKSGQRGPIMSETPYQPRIGDHVKIEGDNDQYNHWTIEHMDENGRFRARHNQEFSCAFIYADKVKFIPTGTRHHNPEFLEKQSKQWRSNAVKRLIIEALELAISKDQLSGDTYDKAIFALEKAKELE
jgi:hypothetical protein